MGYLKVKVRKDLEKVKSKYQNEVDALNQQLAREKVYDPWAVESSFYDGNPDRGIATHWWKLEFVRVSSEVSRNPNRKLPSVIKIDPPAPLEDWDSYYKHFGLKREQEG